jgi:hypothetical protein
LTKKTYEAPVLAKREQLSLIAAAPHTSRPT